MKYNIELEGKELKDLYVLINTLRKVMKVCIKHDLPLDHAFFRNDDNKLIVTKTEEELSEK